MKLQSDKRNIGGCKWACEGFVCEEEKNKMSQVCVGAKWNMVRQFPSFHSGAYSHLLRFVLQVNCQQIYFVFYTYVHNQAFYRVSIAKIMKERGHGSATLSNCSNYVRQVCHDAVFKDGQYLAIKKWVNNSVATKS